jgi:hypothetical protein
MKRRWAILSCYLRNWFLARCKAYVRDADWWRDPLSHPDIKAMSERARADLPFAPERIREE